MASRAHMARSNVPLPSPEGWHCAPDWSAPPRTKNSAECLPECPRQPGRPSSTPWRSKWSAPERCRHSNGLPYSRSISKNTTYMDASVIIGLKASTMSAGWPDISSDPQNESSEDELLVLSSFTFIFPALFRSNKNPCQCQDHHPEQPLGYSKSYCYACHQYFVQCTTFP